MVGDGGGDGEGVHLLGVRRNASGMNLLSLSVSLLTEGYHVMTMRTMKRTVETDRKGPSTPAISFAVSGSRGSFAAVSNRACAVAMTC